MKKKTMPPPPMPMMYAKDPERWHQLVAIFQMSNRVDLLWKNVTEHDERIAAINREAAKPWPDYASLDAPNSPEERKTEERILQALGGMPKKPITPKNPLLETDKIVRSKDLPATEGMLHEFREETRAQARGHDRRFDALEAKIASHDKRFDAVDKRFDAVDAKIDRLYEAFTQDAHKKQMLMEEQRRNVQLIAEAVLVRGQTEQALEARVAELERITNPLR